MEKCFQWILSCLEKGIFFPRLPTEPNCFNKNYMALEQTCSPKQKRCVCLKWASLLFVTERWTVLQRVVDFCCPVFLPTRKPRCPLSELGHWGGCPWSYPALRVFAQGGCSVVKWHLEDVKTQNYRFCSSHTFLLVTCDGLVFVGNFAEHWRVSSLEICCFHFCPQIEKYLLYF